MKYEYQDCPLCGKENTQFYYVDHGNRMYFRCETCKDFQLYIYAQKPLSEKDKAYRSEISLASKNAGEGKVMFITHKVNPINPDVGFALTVEFHDRASLPQR